MAQTLFRLGAIYNVTEKARVWEDATPPARSVLRVHVHPKRFPVERVDWRRAIVDETSDFVVVNKPRGVPVHPTVGAVRAPRCRAVPADRPLLQTTA